MWFTKPLLYRRANPVLLYASRAAAAAVSCEAKIEFIEANSADIGSA
jgi:hypothetical protein